MNILVIDDNERHLKAAEQTLGGEHALTTCSSHDEAYNLLSKRGYEKELLRRAEEHEIDGTNWPGLNKNETDPFWDAVLCDLLMPAGKMAQGGEGLRHVGKVMPVGWALALEAAKSGAKFVAVATDMNHHHHPTSAMLDNLNYHQFQIDGAIAIFTNCISTVGINGTERECSGCSGAGSIKRDDEKYKCWRCDGTGTDFAEYGKDWGKILEALIDKK